MCSKVGVIVWVPNNEIAARTPYSFLSVVQLTLVSCGVHVGAYLVVESPAIDHENQDNMAAYQLMSPRV